LRILLLLIIQIIAFQTQAQSAVVAIIIDDIGYRKTDINVLQLPTNITLSVLPHTPYGKQIAQQGFNANHDVMLHIPMEATNGKFLGPGGLTHDMDEETIRRHLKAAYKEVPFAIGINNHMGSLLTALEQPMSWVMKFIKEKNMIFIDSATSTQSKAGSIAKTLGILTRPRNVFLDNQLEHAYIAQQFEQLIKQAKQKKSAIAIAHPHPETINSIKRLLPLLSEQQIELVTVTELFKHNNNQ